MTAGGEGGARARPPPSHSAAGAELVLAGKVRSTSRAWPAERRARRVQALAAWGLPPACRPFPLAPRPFQIPASPLPQGVPWPWPGAVSCAHVTSFPGERPASGGGWPVRPCTPPSARAGPEAFALRVVLSHPSSARVPGSEGVGTSDGICSPLISPRRRRVCFVVWWIPGPAPSTGGRI